MWRWTWMALVLCLAGRLWAAERPDWRTDGPEGSEYGRGGDRRPHSARRFFVEGHFGAAMVDSKEDGNDAATELLGGVELGYMVEDWLTFQVGYGYIADAQISLFSLGMRSIYDMEPFNYYFSLGTELYSPQRGEDKFGIVPGIGVEMLLSDHLRVGLGYQHDFIFADEKIRINRFSARVRLVF